MSSSGAEVELDPLLERATLLALVRAWRDINYTYFKGSLIPPVLRLSSSSSRWGVWNPADRSISLSRRLVVEHGWGTVLEVLKHEVAHQYVHEVLQRTDEAPHGETFREVCERLGIDGAARGPLTRNEGDAKVMRRVAKLLALGTSPNEHEAQAAMSQAQQLMLRHNIVALPGEREYGFRHLGKPSGRVFESQRVLAGILSRHFFVEVIWVPVWRPIEGKRGKVLEVCGTTVNLDMAEHVHTFLNRTSADLWERHKRQRGIGNRDRQAFLAGVMTGFRAKLDEQERKNREQALVWVGDADLERYYRRRHPHIRYRSHRSSAATAAHAHGHAAGRRIELNRPLPKERGAGLLPPRR